MDSEQIASQGGLGATWTTLPAPEAAALARERFNISGSVDRFATEKDDTFRLKDDSGNQFVLKVANPAEREDEVAFQVDLLLHIERKAPALPVPRVISSRRGETYSYYVDQAGQNRWVRLLSYLPGTPLSDTSASAREREMVGRTLGLLRLATADFSHPADSRALPWDVKHLSKLAHLVDHIEDEERRAKLLAAVERFMALEPLLARCHTQVLHNDFSKSNIVTDHAYPGFVTGIIDFGDAVRTAVAIDVATALLNHLPSEKVADIFQHGRDLLCGYLTVADLTQDELALIPHLVMARVVARTLLTTWRSQLLPENRTYIMRNTEQGWAQLDWFLKRPVNEVSASLMDMTAGNSFRSGGVSGDG